MVLQLHFTRQQLKNRLMEQGGEYLVLITYPFSHNGHFEWVFNDADIDRAPLFRARDMARSATTNSWHILKTVRFCM